MAYLKPSWDKINEGSKSDKSRYIDIELQRSIYKALYQINCIVRTVFCELSHKAIKYV